MLVGEIQSEKVKLTNCRIVLSLNQSPEKGRALQNIAFKQSWVFLTRNANQILSTLPSWQAQSCNDIHSMAFAIQSKHKDSLPQHVCANVVK